MDDEKIVLGNRVSPFAEKVVGLPAFCMMTSNAFGSIATADLGYAKVVWVTVNQEVDRVCRGMPLVGHRPVVAINRPLLGAGRFGRGETPCRIRPILFG